MQNTEGVQPYHPPVLAFLSWFVGVAMALAIVIGMGIGKATGIKGGIAMLILAAIPICTLGTGLAIASLIWRRENKHIVQGALWLNGLIAFFAFPIMIYWLLAMWE